MNILVEIFSNNYYFNIPDETNNKYRFLLNLIEDKIKISPEFFILKFSNKLLNCEDDFEALSDNSIVNLIWQHDCFDKELRSLYVYDNEYKLPESILLESIVIRTVICNSDDEDDFNILDKEDKIVFNTDHINKDCVNHWINMSILINNYLKEDNRLLEDLKIPKPLQNKKIFYYIGSRASNYLDALDFETVQKFATFTDFLDISYLLEVICAFIAEKYVKNNSIDNIKKLFNNIEV